MPSRRVWILALAAAAVTLTVAGIWTARSAMTIQFGWFAYSPLTDAVPLPAHATSRAWAGWIVTALGLMLLSGLVGFILGSRRGSRDLL
ncbi:MAG: hypothetical protein ABIO48_04040 [Pedococcus sp.]